jgi:hypothetical protein
VRPAGSVPEDLVAERDCVVREPVLRVQIRRALVHVHRLGDPLQLQVQIADPVEQGELVGKLGLPLELVEQLAVEIDRPLEIPLILELLRLELDLLDVQG